MNREMLILGGIVGALGALGSSAVDAGARVEAIDPEIKDRAQPARPLQTVRHERKEKSDSLRRMLGSKGRK